FSSSRRHTRFSRDWSSDVCSSDLTFSGFRIAVVGKAPAAAAYAGYSRNRVVVASFLISGGLAGLAGIVEVSGTIGQLQPLISPRSEERRVGGGEGCGTCA